ncbi:MAG: 2-hydroxymuconate tautomerase family protein [Clostridia bacterium]|nr:2-hydroxymuconate tautomerase family protein [Clostridia bacterium]
MPIINIELWSGRTHEQKKELAKAFTESMVNILKVKPESVQIIFKETDKKNWAIGGKLPDEW